MSWQLGLYCSIVSVGGGGVGGGDPTADHQAV